MENKRPYDPELQEEGVSKARTEAQMPSSILTRDQKINWQGIKRAGL